MNTTPLRQAANDAPDLTADQIEACATWIQQGRDAYLDGDNLCPFMATSIAGCAWEHGWLQARRDVREWAAAAVA